MKIEDKIKFLNKNTPIKNTFNKDTVVHCIHCKDNYYAYECSIENNQILCKDIINCDGSIIDWVVKNKKKLKYFRNYINDNSFLNQNLDDLNVAIITPDKDIIPDAENLSPAFVVFDNYEIILQWNRSLRFSLAVCTLKDKFKNEF